MTQDLQQKIENIISSNPQADDREVLFQLKRLLYETELQESIDKEAKNITDLVAENIQQLKGESEKSDSIKSGFLALDNLLGGFRRSEFIVVGARPGMGKMQFLINLSLNISLEVPVLFVTLDLSEFLLTNRFISSISEIPLRNILQHDLNEVQKYTLNSIGDKFAYRRLFIHDSRTTSITAVKAHCQKQIQENGIQVIVIDYLQMLNYFKYRNNYRELEVSYICRELKNMAKEYNVCIIVGSQLSRSVESRSVYSKRPLLSDLRDSGSIEQDADKVLFIYRPEYYRLDSFEDDAPSAGLADIIVAKNRSGGLGDVRLRRDFNFTNFRDFSDDFEFLPNRLYELSGLQENELEENVPY